MASADDLNHDVKTQIHRAVFDGKVNKLRQILSHNPKSVDSKDKHGNTGLHLAAMLGRKECIDLLLSFNATVKLKNLQGWTALAEARSYGNRETILALLQKLKTQQRKHMEERKPKLLAAMRKIQDFKMEIKWDFHSWIPFVSRYLPCDVAVVRKRGTCLRVDSTLVDFSEMKWVRGDISFIYDGEDTQRGIVMMDNVQKCYQRITYEESDMETEEEVDLLMGSDIISATMTVEDVYFTRATSGLLFQGYRVAQIGEHQVDFYHLEGFKMIQRKRREHLSPEDIKKNKAMLDVFSAVQSKAQLQEASVVSFRNCSKLLALVWWLPEDEKVIVTLMFQIPRRNTIPPPKKKKISWREYISAPAGQPPVLGRDWDLKDSSKTFRPTLGMSPTYPLSVDMLLDVLEIVAPLKQFNKLKDFVEIKLPPGFPIRIELPILPTITAEVTFISFAFDPNIPESLFRVPEDYTHEQERGPMSTVMAQRERARLTVSASKLLLLETESPSSSPDRRDSVIHKAMLSVDESMYQLSATVDAVVADSESEEPADPDLAVEESEMSKAGLPSTSAGLPSTSADFPSTSAGFLSTLAGFQSPSAGLPSTSAGLPSTSGQTTNGTTMGLPSATVRLQSNGEAGVGCFSVDKVIDVPLVAGFPSVNSSSTAARYEVGQSVNDCYEPSTRRRSVSESTIFKKNQTRVYHFREGDPETFGRRKPAKKRRKLVEFLKQLKNKKGSTNTATGSSRMLKTFRSTKLSATKRKAGDVVACRFARQSASLPTLKAFPGRSDFRCQCLPVAAEKEEVEVSERPRQRDQELVSAEKVRPRTSTEEQKRKSVTKDRSENLRREVKVSINEWEMASRKVRASIDEPKGSGFFVHSDARSDTSTEKDSLDGYRGVYFETRCRLPSKVQARTNARIKETRKISSQIEVAPYLQGCPSVLRAGSVDTSCSESHSDDAASTKSSSSGTKSLNGEPEDEETWTICRRLRALLVSMFSVRLNLSSLPLRHNSL
ncbi:unnamed protein product [Cyprideis torosa]|uniref:Ankyrin repeat domain-containing protein n=1 Tax=Cyprideis torosa TaxID=163714 RepID=A0A7R8W8C6_9CRUS|nr:unnamed protein product [Cyprideis torosa]CAG0888436.1 unnamed protein product [Cyprideis torosa]